jgi:hypothetical protein
LRTRIVGLLAGALLACGGGDDGGFEPVRDAPAALASPLDVWALSPTEVWIVDGSATVYRFDGGSWSTLAAPRAVSCIFALSREDVFLCGGDAVVHHDGATFTVSEVTATAGLDGLSGIWASSREDVWVVGDDAIVARRSGAGWSRTVAGGPFKSSIWGSSPTDVYALSTFDLVRWDGARWTEVDLDGGGGDGQVTGTSAADVWVVTGSEDVAHGGGAAWTTEELDLVGDLSTIWAASPSDVWAAGSAGSIAHHDGSSWTQLAHQEIGAPYLRQWLAVHGAAGGDVWLVGRELGQGGARGLIWRRGR